MKHECGKQPTEEQGIQINWFGILEKYFAVFKDQSGYTLRVEHKLRQGLLIRSVSRHISRSL